MLLWLLQTMIAERKGLLQGVTCRKSADCCIGDTGPHKELLSDHKSEVESQEIKPCWYSEAKSCRITARTPHAQANPVLGTMKSFASDSLLSTLWVCYAFLFTKLTAVCNRAGCAYPSRHPCHQDVVSEGSICVRKFWLQNLPSVLHGTQLLPLGAWQRLLDSD